jgi:hypothetical protein
MLYLHFDLAVVRRFINMQFAVCPYNMHGNDRITAKQSVFYPIFIIQVALKKDRFLESVKALCFMTQSLFLITAKQHFGVECTMQFHEMVAGDDAVPGGDE